MMQTGFATRAAIALISRFGGGLVAFGLPRESPPSERLFFASLEITICDENQGRNILSCIRADTGIPIPKAIGARLQGLVSTKLKS